MKKTYCVLVLTILLVGLMACPMACSRPPAPPPKAEQKQQPMVVVGPVPINPHPASLAGKTVVLRWNGNCNGDTFLSSLAALLKHELKQIKIVKMWEVDASTAVVTQGLGQSEAIAGAIAAQKPALVITAQADSD